MHLPNETSVTTLNAVTVNVWLWLEIILNKPRRLVLSAISLDYQVIIEKVHEKVHETTPKVTFPGSLFFV